MVGVSGDTRDRPEQGTAVPVAWAVEQFLLYMVQFLLYIVSLCDRADRV